MDKLHLYDKILSPIVTEKTTNLSVQNKVVFKVPKNATFNLNTRHCKVKLPNTKAFGKVSYGGFNASDLNGGRLIKPNLIKNNQTIEGNCYENYIIEKGDDFGSINDRIWCHNR